MNDAPRPACAARLCGALVAAIGAVVLIVGWWVGVEWVPQVLTGFPELKANGAVALVLLGSSLVLSTYGEHHRVAATLLASLAGVIGAAIVAEHLFGSLGIDQALASDPAAMDAPGRPSLHSAIALVLAALTLIAANASGTLRHRPYLILFILLSASSGLAALGYLYYVSYLHDAGVATGMAFPMMLAMVTLTIGVALSAADREPVAMLLRPTPGGELARRLVPAVLLLVLALGGLQQLSSGEGMQSAQVGTSVLVLAIVITIVIAVLRSAKLLDLRVEHDSTRLRAVVDATHEAYIAIDERGTVIEWNPAAQETFGWSRAESVGRELAELLAPERHRASYRSGIAGLSAPGINPDLGRRIELNPLHKGGREIPVELTVTALDTDRGRTFSAFLLDITERKKVETQRERQLHSANRAAQTDELTGLPNRRALAGFLATAVEPSQANIDADISTWLAMLDIDRFKQYNDTHGHPAGDRVLRESAAAWRGTLRTTDFISRHGGEEFVVVLPQISEEGARITIERLRGKTPLGQTCSAGVARWEIGDSAETLVARADTALYEAKESGRDRLVLAA